MPDTRESFKLESAGAQTVGTGKDRWIAAFNGEITGIEAVVGTAPTGASLIFDLKKNGTSLYVTATKPTILAAATKTASKFAPDSDASQGRFVTGDTFSLDVTQVGSTVAGSDADVVVEYLAQ